MGIAYTEDYDEMKRLNNNDSRLIFMRDLDVEISANTEAARGSGSLFYEGMNTGDAISYSLVAY